MKTPTYLPKNKEESKQLFHLLYALGYKMGKSKDASSAIETYSDWVREEDGCFIRFADKTFDFNNNKHLLGNEYCSYTTIGEFIQAIIDLKPEPVIESPKTIDGKDIRVGQHITVEAWLPDKNGHIDHSWCGDVLLVEAVNYPYVIVKNKTDTWLSRPLQLDVRELKFMELTQAYVTAALAK